MSVEVIFIKTSTYLPSGFQNLIMKKISLIFLLSFFLFASNTNAQVFTPTVNITTSLNNFCSGSSVIIKATPTMGDTVLSYNFIVNGISKQNSIVDSFISTAFNNNDSVICILYSGKYNASPDSAISNKLYFQVRKKSSKSINRIICPGDSTLFHGNYYHVAGSYSVSLSNYLNCDSIVTLHLQLAIKPTVTLFPRIDSVCSGSMKILTAGGALSYTWNPASVGGINDTVMPSHTTTYIVTGTDLYGCTDTAQSLIITTNNKPKAAFTYTDSANIYTFNNTSTYATSYLWIFGDGGISTDKNPVNAYPIIGTFTAQLIATGLCGNDTFSVSFATGISDLTNPIMMQVYPNPCKQSLMVSHQPSVNSVEVIDVVGRIVNCKSQTANSLQTIVDVSGLSNGIYFVKIIDNKGNSAITKFIKE